MKKDYVYFSVEDFIADEYFQQWARFPDKESNAFWNQWRTRNPGKEPDVRAALSFINSLQFNTRFPPPSQAELSLERNLQKISKTGEQNLQRRKDIFRTLPMRIFIIAGIVAVCALAAWLYFTRSPVMDEVTTRNGEIRNIMLNDSTAVILNGNASLSYPADFLAGDKREVWIEGEGFFVVQEVAGAGPRYAKFIVHTKDLDVETSGSSFNVKSIDSASGVSVNSGKIKIYINGLPEKASDMNAGDFIQYSSAGKRVLRKKVDPGLYSGWKDVKVDLK